MPRPVPHRRAFTLIEFLVLMAILALVAALALTGIQRARTAAMRADCQSRLRNQAIAVFHHESREGRLPPGSISGPFAPMNVPEDVNHGLWAVLLGELDQKAAADLYRWDVNYDDPLNQPAVNAMIPVLLCPAHDPTRVDRWPDGGTARVADYAPLEVNAFLADIGLLDPAENFDSALPVNGMVKTADITDGLSNTILLAEAAGRPGIAWSSSDIPVSVRFVLSGGVHGGGTNIALCDGSVRMLRHSIDMRVLAKLATRRGGEAIEGDW